MCILSYLPPHTEVDKDALFNGGINNPHGHGWAIVAGERILVGKSMELDTALEEFIDVRAQHRDGPALFHSRWATHGAKNTDNVHPFMVNGSPTTYVAHNGVLKPSAHPEKGDPRSDTRKFADEILGKQYRRLDRPGVRYALEQWLGTGNKLVILTVDPRYACSGYIFNEELGVWDDDTGLWHSNTDFKWPRYARYGTGRHGSCWGYGGYYDWDQPYVGKYSGTSTSAKHRVADRLLEDDDRCRWCQSGHVDRHGYCDACLSCEDCSEAFNDCLCYCEDEDVAKVEAWENAKAEEAAFEAAYEADLLRMSERWGSGTTTMDVVQLDNGTWAAGKAS